MPTASKVLCEGRAWPDDSKTWTANRWKTKDGESQYSDSLVSHGAKRTANTGSPGEWSERLGAEDSYRAGFEHGVEGKPSQFAVYDSDEHHQVEL